MGNNTMGPTDYSNNANKYYLNETESFLNDPFHDNSQYYQPNQQSSIYSKIFFF